MSVSQTSHFDAVYALLPPALKAAIDDLLSRATRESAVKHTLDQLVRFSLGREAIDDDPDSREDWDAQRHKAEQALSSLYQGDKGKKRAREEDGSSTQELETKSKKAKMEAVSSDDEDHPIFTLHTVSVSSPIRKKVHITISGKNIRFTHATTGAREASLPLSSLTRAFLISTPGKTKPHWTVILFADTDQNQIIFGLDAVLPSLSTTAHPAPPHSYPKGTESKPAITQLLSHLPPHITLQEPSTAQFRSSGGEPYVDAYLRAKDGHLLFFKDGLLFGEKKPCMWIGMEVIDSVRSLSATGRTFSLFVNRVADNLDDEEEEDGEETEFSLIDGKNQDAVAQWVKDNRHKFGVPLGSKGKSAAARGRAEEVDELAADGDGDEETPEKREDSEDLDDSDFESDSDSDGGSASSESSGEGGKEAHEEEEAHSDSGDDEMEEEEELSASKHPLLRPGAMPKMSRAAMEAVVGMVEHDMVGVAGGRATGDDDEDQLDELDD